MRGGFREQASVVHGLHGLQPTGICTGYGDWHWFRYQSFAHLSHRISRSHLSFSSFVRIVHILNSEVLGKDLLL